MSFVRHIGNPDVLELQDDGRTVEGLIVPYESITEVIDIHPVTNKLEKFRECFMRESFMHAIQIAERRGNAGFISLNLEHNEHIRDGRIGYAKTIEERDDGAHAAFRLYESDDLPKVQSMLRESHTGLSIKFADLRPPKWIDGVVRHVQVALEHVAATPIPAYPEARILALRSDDEGDQLIAQLDEARPHLDETRQWLDEMRKAMTT